MGGLFMTKQEVEKLSRSIQTYDTAVHHAGREVLGIGTFSSFYMLYLKVKEHEIKAHNKNCSTVVTLKYDVDNEKLQIGESQSQMTTWGIP